MARSTRAADNNRSHDHIVLTVLVLAADVGFLALILRGF